MIPANDLSQRRGQQATDNVTRNMEPVPLRARRQTGSHMTRSFDAVVRLGHAGVRGSAERRG